MTEAFDAAATLAPAELPGGFGAAQGVEPLRVSSSGYATGPAESPASTGYDAAVMGEIEVSQSAFDALGVGGRVALGVADVVVRDLGIVREIARLGTAVGRAAIIRTAPVISPRARNRGTPLATAPIAFRGVVRAVSEEGDFRARIAVADAAERLNEPLQPTRYDGSGGVEGGTELKDRPKPVLLGQCYNVPAVFLGNVDLGVGIGSLPTFQVHWRDVVATDAVRVRGVPQTPTGGAPTGGQFRDFPALGMFQLGGSPDGDVTADVRGDTAPSYANTTATIVRRVLESLGPQLAASAIDDAAFRFADIDLPGIVGFYQGAEAISAASAVDAILAGSGAILAGGRAGKMRLCDPISMPDVSQFDVRAGWIIEAEPVPMPMAFRPPPRAVEVEWRRNWRPLSNIAGSVAAADRERLSRSSSIARAESSIISGRSALQRTLTLPGLYYDEAPATARAEQLRAWVEGGPRAIRIVTDRYLDQIEIGHVGRVTFPAFDLHRGFRGAVVGWREMFQARRVEMILVGIPT